MIRILAIALCLAACGDPASDGHGDAAAGDAHHAATEPHGPAQEAPEAAGHGAAEPDPHDGHGEDAHADEAHAAQAGHPGDDALGDEGHAAPPPEPGHGEPPADPHGPPADAHGPPADAHPPPADVADPELPPATPEPTDGAEETAPIAPLRPIRVLWALLGRLALGLAALLAVRWLGRAARRRVPRLQDEVKLAQLVLVAVISTVTFFAALQALQKASPMAALVAMAALGAGGLLYAGYALPAYLQGLVLMLGPTIKLGDHVDTGTISGRLTEVGMVRLTLTGDDGTLHSVPVGVLGAASVSVVPRRGSHPLRATLSLSAPPSATLVDAVRAHALLSPYRDPTGPVVVTSDGATMRIELVVWGHDLAPLAERHLRNVVARHLGDGPPAAMREDGGTTSA